MENDEYYDIDIILAEQNKVPCIFQVAIDAEVNVLGDHSQVTAESKHELPYWLAKPLAQYKLPSTGEILINVEVPKSFSPRVRNSIEASATSADLNSLCPYFYLFGYRIVNLMFDKELHELLYKAFRLRIKDVMDYSETGTARYGTEFLYKIDETEKELFMIGQKHSSDLKHWFLHHQQELKYSQIHLRSAQ
ncbi:hypothetical protein BCR43DRAFT_497658 [Syncephalastrum racemosum]|uniref:DNA replication complex GINS protein PSF3 n=1 Tax=Syncephalastrum racemosum TaxID=13706 RepID=A0A1X2H2I6_SYNRA|nr:hypothetical protein BCR43DRAFT_497658 [Syncephalastrum racemosum]